MTTSFRFALAPLLGAFVISTAGCSGGSGFGGDELVAQSADEIANEPAPENGGGECAETCYRCGGKTFRCMRNNKTALVCCCVGSITGAMLPKCIEVTASSALSLGLSKSVPIWTIVCTEFAALGLAFGAIVDCATECTGWKCFEPQVTPHYSGPEQVLITGDRAPPPAHINREPVGMAEGGFGIHGDADQLRDDQVTTGRERRQAWVGDDPITEAPHEATRNNTNDDDIEAE